MEKTQEVVPEGLSYQTKWVDDLTLPLGQEKVVQKGQTGLINHHYTVLSAKGDILERKLDRHETIREAQDEVIYRGVLETRQETDTKVVPHQTKRVKNPDLEVGQTRIKVKGQDGLDQLTYENQYAYGLPINGQLQSTTRQVEPIDEVIEEGTKQTVIETIQASTKLPYISVIEKDDTLPKGVRKVVVEGKDGSLHETYEVTTVNGQEVARKVIETHQEDPIYEEVHLGTKEEVVALPGQPVLPQTGDATILTTLIGQGMLLGGVAMVQRKKRH